MAKREKVQPKQEPASTQIIEALDDSDQYMKRRDIMGDSGIKYRVAIRKSDSRWTCSCPHWCNVQNKKNLDCKHISRLKAEFGAAFADGLDAGRVDMFSVLRAALSLTGDALVDKWLAIKDKAFLMEDYLKMMEDNTATQDYSTLLNSVKSLVMEALNV